MYVSQGTVMPTVMKKPMFWILMVRSHLDGGFLISTKLVDLDGRISPKL